MRNKYIIVNVETVQKRIEELGNKRDAEHKKGHDKSAIRYENTIVELKGILSQSTPLMPEIEKAFDEGSENPRLGGSYPQFEMIKEQEQAKQDYIKQLKL